MQQHVSQRLAQFGLTFGKLLSAIMVHRADHRTQQRVRRQKKQAWSVPQLFNQPLPLLANAARRLTATGQFLLDRVMPQPDEFVDVGLGQWSDACFFKMQILEPVLRDRFRSCRDDELIVGVRFDECL